MIQYLYRNCEAFSSEICGNSINIGKATAEEQLQNISSEQMAVDLENPF